MDKDLERNLDGVNNEEIDIVEQDRTNQDIRNQDRISQENMNQSREIQARIVFERQEQDRLIQERQNQDRMRQERMYQDRIYPENINQGSNRPVQKEGTITSEMRLNQPEMAVADSRYTSTARQYTNAYPNDYHQVQGTPNNSKTKKKKMKPVLKYSLIAMIFTLFIGAFSALAVQSVKIVNNYMDDKENIQENVFAEIKPEVESEEPLLQQTSEIIAVVTDVTQVVETVMPSVVSIYSTMKGQQDILGNIVEGPESGGSGIIVGENETELLIVTNNHVVANAVELKVQFIDGEEVLAQVKGRNEEMDIAIIAIPLDDLLNTTKDSIMVAELGDSDSLKVGEPAIAIGNALGYGQSVTTGVISALNRELTVENITNTLIQTDAAINPGNSGGALLNIKGEVIGINSNKIGGSTIEGMGYAIPISAAIPIIEELMVKETRYVIDEDERGYLGVEILNATQDIAEAYGFPVGVFIRSVTPNGGANQAGILQGDIITSIDGEAVTSGDGLMEQLQYFEKGQEVELTILRNSSDGYKEGIIKVTLGEKGE